MKKIIQMYAKYNHETNKKIIKILSSLSKNDLIKDRNFYYKSLIELFKHITMGSWHYINAISYISEKKYNKKLPKLDEIINSFNSFEPIMFKYLLVLDVYLIELSNEINEKDFDIGKKGVKIYNGRIIDITIWEYFLQHMTHQTHHQGQMSKIFDELKIEHEFGNIFPLIQDSVSVDK